MAAVQRVLIILICSLPGTLPAPVTITRDDPLIQRRTFDPKNHPSDMPRLTPNEAAVAQSYFGADSRLGGPIIRQEKIADGVHVWIKVDHVRMTLQMRVTIWLPTDPVPKLVNHEEGHRKIAEQFYQTADTVAHDLASEMIGQVVTGKGPDADTAADNALKEAAQVLGRQYLDKTDVPCGKAQDVYDQITAHGTNAIKEENAIKQAINQVANAAPGGSSP